MVTNYLRTVFRSLVHNRYFNEQNIFWADSSFLTMFSFKLVSGNAEKATIHKTKEIGIRKALEASIHSLIALLSKEFVKWLLIAIITISFQAVKAATANPVESLK